MGVGILSQQDVVDHRRELIMVQWPSACLPCLECTADLRLKALALRSTELPVLRCSGLVIIRGFRLNNGLLKIRQLGIQHNTRTEPQLGIVSFYSWHLTVS